jgi:hypothetical protein
MPGLLCGKLIFAQYSAAANVPDLGHQKVSVPPVGKHVASGDDTCAG